MQGKLHWFAAAALTLCLCAAPRTGAQNVSVKANALSWALATPDLGVELTTGERTSVAFSFMGHYKPYTYPSKMFSFQPEFRYWISGRPLTREYVGVVALASMYDLNWSAMHFLGVAAGAGISGGYVFNLGRHWCFELSAGCGLLAFRQKQYMESDHYDDYIAGASDPANNWGYKIFPMKLAATFIYVIK